MTDSVCVITGGVSGFLTIDQVRELDLGHGDKPDYFNCKSTITFCKKDNCLYKVSSVPPRCLLKSGEGSDECCFVEGVSECRLQQESDGARGPVHLREV